MVGTLTLTLILAAYTYKSARQAIVDATLLTSATMCESTTSKMELLFKSVAGSMQNFVADPHVTSLFDNGSPLYQGPDQNDAIARVNAWMEIVSQGNEFYRDIFVVDSKGICLASSNPGFIGKSYINEKYVSNALVGIFGFNEPRVGLVTKNLTFMYAGPIDREQGVAGALIIVGELPKVVNYNAEAGQREHSTIFTSLLSPAGLFAAHPDRNIMENKDLLFPQLYEELAGLGEKGAVANYSLNGQQYVGYVKLERNSRWLVIASGPEDQVFASAYKTGFTVLIISFVFLCLIAFVVVRFANGILNSLLSLIGYAKKVSEGDMEENLPSTSRQDELGILHNALMRLVGSLREMIAKSTEASQMKGNFLANMSHEIRTPLNAIIGMVHLSRRDEGLSPVQKDYQEKIMLAAKTLLGIINDILDVSKVEAGMMNIESIAFDLKNTMQNALSIHQDNAREKGLTLSLDYQLAGPSRFIGDPLRITQVVNNLLSNAIKFTRHGRVTLSVNGNALTPDEKCLVNISVADTGIGISAEALESLFKPFTQADTSTSRKFGGTGLGLTISDRLVQLMGGAFNVSSQPEKGSTFAFSISLLKDMNYDEKTQHTAKAEHSKRFSKLNLSGRSILVAEDNAVNQFILKSMLAPTAAEIVLADNGREAVTALEQRSFDIVLMDVQMPVMDGYEATRLIRGLANGKSVPIIAVTANAMQEDRKRSRESGMNDYITKPIEPDDLWQILNSWIPHFER